MDHRPDGQDDWSVLSGRLTEAEGGRQMIARVRLGQFSPRAAERYPVRLMFEIELASPTEHGLPELDEQGRLDNVEDALAEVARLTKEAVLLLLVSSNNKRTIVLQTSDDRWHEKYRKPVADAFGGYSATIYTERDPEWSVYKGFVDKAQ